MAISNLVAATSASTIAQTFTAAATTSYYQSSKTFDPGIYTVTCSTSVVAVVDFYSSSGEVVTTATTVNGTVTVNIAQSISKVGYYVNTGTNVLISITLTGQAITSAASGTLDTITSSGTYNQTGQLYVVCVGAGGGGGGGAQYRQGGNGGAGGFAGGKFFTTSATTITIGAGGGPGSTANTSSNNGNGGATGGATSFGNLLSANGGAGGNQANTVSGGNTGAAGNPLNSAPYGFMSTPGTSGGNYGERGNNYRIEANSGSNGIVYVLRGL